MMKKIVRINKLFGKYNNEIDLSNRCIIFIGENGVRKNNYYENNTEFDEL